VFNGIAKNSTRNASHNFTMPQATQHAMQHASPKATAHATLRTISHATLRKHTHWQARTPNTHATWVSWLNSKSGWNSPKTDKEQNITFQFGWYSGTSTHHSGTW